jgi:hypothetical protein
MRGVLDCVTAAFEANGGKLLMPQSTIPGVGRLFNLRIAKEMWHVRCITIADPSAKNWTKSRVKNAAVRLRILRTAAFEMIRPFEYAAACWERGHPVRNERFSANY